MSNQSKTQTVGTNHQRTDPQIDHVLNKNQVEENQSGIARADYQQELAQNNGFAREAVDEVYTRLVTMAKDHSGTLEYEGDIKITAGLTMIFDYIQLEYPFMEDQRFYTNTLKDTIKAFQRNCHIPDNGVIDVRTASFIVSTLKPDLLERIV
jgi:murein L,D-transpeptidase YcbB/YkuD